MDIKTVLEKLLVLEKVKTWLKEEIEHNEAVFGDEQLSDGTEFFHEGRSECAASLLEQIEKWEKK